MLTEHNLRLRAPPSAIAAVTSATANNHYALYATQRLRSSGGGEPASVPSSLIAAGGITRRCDFSTLISILVALPHADPHLLRLRVSHNRKKTQEYNERKCALALFSVLCRYAVALDYPLGRRGGGDQVVALLLRAACAGSRQVGVSRGGFVPTAPFGRACAVGKPTAFLTPWPPELIIFANNIREYSVT